MSAPIEQTLPAIEATYKARDVEGIFDLRFYRPIGFRLAQFFAKLHVTPTQVTFVGACFGVVAGHLYFYQSLAVNIAGMMLHVISNVFDNVDGQLARLTNQKSLTGRALDGFADHTVFASIYLHLGLRYFMADRSPTIILLVIAAALSHAWQSALAEYSRNTYLFMVNERPGADTDSSAASRQEYQALSWASEPWKKFLLGMYANFTRNQEFFAPKLFALRQTASQIDLHGFRQAAQPMLTWWRFAMTNTRMVCLFVSLLIGRPIWYLWLEVTVFNLLVAILLFRQEQLAGRLVATVGS
jgi:phosphatidylglycerophosphate synthase